MGSVSSKDGVGTPPGSTNSQRNRKLSERGRNNKDLQALNTPQKTQNDSAFENLQRQLQYLKDHPDELIKWLQSVSVVRERSERGTQPGHNQGEQSLGGIQEYWDKTLHLGQEVQKLKARKQELLNKLSEAAGARLKNNNPAIADLSDRNRPSKLAEQFSELYDNEWTDTAEELKEMVKDEKFSDDEERETRVVRFLCEVLKKTYQWCASRSEHQLRDVIAAVQLRYDDGNKDHGDHGNPVVQKKCKDLLKENGLQIAESNDLKEKIRKETAESLFHGDMKCFRSLGTKDAKRSYYESFLSKCVKLCWLMACQDPPVVLEYLSQNLDLYRAYTRSGDCLDYVVWPSLLLHKDGPLLYKGVAQLKPRGADVKEKKRDVPESVLSRKETNEKEENKTMNEGKLKEEKREENNQTKEDDSAVNAGSGQSAAQVHVVKDDNTKGGTEANTATSGKDGGEEEGMKSGNNEEKNTSSKQGEYKTVINVTNKLPELEEV